MNVFADLQWLVYGVNEYCDPRSSGVRDDIRDS